MIDNEMIIHSKSYDQGSKEWVERVFIRRVFDDFTGSRIKELR